tara:strand:+ start:274 stop:489 length:216 start_codon:yes stop_codon:yes gene_type:complete
MDLDTLRTLKRNKKELLKAEERILEAVSVDYMNGFLTDPIVSEKIFEISDLIVKVSIKIKECREHLKKNKK